ncbi:hypothetical protein NQ314_001648 [Rhamnusium bicolor]|uniref:MFS transporter n=1 Tax=Rhamnusium bicolor TaxID=1586634 RepID=A0AAV8ZSV8_9CUCU|nr:hypothetical protein NQ314_001648 [Rhamnusium bicolor]
MASLSVLRSIVIVELMGLENLTNAFGVTTMFYGLASFAGVPIAGVLRNSTGKYEASFLFFWVFFSA